MNTTLERRGERWPCRRAADEREPPEEFDAIVQTRGLCLHYGAKQSLFDISMDFPRHQVTALIGPSGCGKSTLLRCLNRMNDLIDDVPIAGSIVLDGEEVNDPTLDVIELRRRVGMVFQKAVPFPKSIYENVAYGLRIAGIRDRRVLDEAVEKSLRRSALWDEVKERLGESALGLSGGQHQRLCIARAIAVSPEIILMDEPARRSTRVDDADRGPDRRTARRVYDHHRHAQHAAGGPGLGLYGLSLRRGAGGVRPDQAAVYQADEEGDGGLHYGAVRMTRRPPGGVVSR